MSSRILGGATLAILEMNQVAARLAVTVKTSAANVRIECFEVGVDGAKPETPLAVAAPDFSLRIGTPFLWSPVSQPRYAVVVSAAQDGKTELGEIQFGFDATGKIVVTQSWKPIYPTPPKRNLKLPSLFVVGDSTAFSNGENQRGWGDELGSFFDLAKINVLNRARPGRSTRSFRNEGLWARVLTELKPGDVVLLQFGHNDADKLAEGRCRGVLPGVGAETQMVTMPGGAQEIVRTFGWYLREFVEETKTRGATPILLSLTLKNLWREGRLERQQSDYGKWSAAVAAACGIDFIDVTQIIADHYDALGWQEVQPLFCSPSDHVHTSPAGARLNAVCVGAGLKEIKSPNVSSYLRHES
jgi:lysophospholipase L1-like esterase